MEENISLAEAVINDILPSNKYEQFDYGNCITNEQKQILIEDAKNAAVGRNACLEIMVSLYGRAIKHANDFYGKNGYGFYQNYVKVCLELSISTAKRILKCYEEVYNHPDKVLYDNNGNEKKILDLGAHKVRAISSLPEDIKEEIYDNAAPLFDMNVKEVNNLVKQVKESGEYSPDLIEQVKQKDDKIKTTEAKTEQLQKEKEQKDQEIAELKAKLQKMEEEKAQPVENSEPEVVEKIIEVEKVVEKEVIPDYVQNELDRLREEVADKDSRLKSAKNTLEAIATQQNSKLGNDSIDWEPLGANVKYFLNGVGEFAYMAEAYKNESNSNKKYIQTQVDKVEKWIIQMKQMMNESIVTIGNVIYTDAAYEINESGENKDD